MDEGGLSPRVERKRDSSLCDPPQSLLNHAHNNTVAFRHVLFFTKRLTSLLPPNRARAGATVRRGVRVGLCCVCVWGGERGQTPAHAAPVADDTQQARDARAGEAGEWARGGGGRALCFASGRLGRHVGVSPPPPLSKPRPLSHPATRSAETRDTRRVCVVVCIACGVSGRGERRRIAGVSLEKKTVVDVFFALFFTLFASHLSSLPHATMDALPPPSPPCWLSPPTWRAPSCP